MTIPIMIDDVNVRNCKYYDKIFFHCLANQGRNDCMDDPNCYYKQHQRKTAAYDDLRELFQYDINRRHERINELKQEIAELKKSGSELLAEKNAFEIGMQQWRDKAKELEAKLQRMTAKYRGLKSELELETGLSYKYQAKLQIATEALENSLQVFDELDNIGAYEEVRQALERIKE